MNQSKWSYIFLMLVIVNFIIVCYLTIKIQPNSKENNLKMDQNPTILENKLTIITYSRNQAEFQWFEKRYQELIDSIPYNEQPLIICYVCNSKELPNFDPKKYKFLFISSETCNLYKIYIQALKILKSDFFTFMDPGFTISKDIIPFLTLNTLSGNGKTVYMILTLESRLNSGETVELEEDQGDLVNKFEKKILRDYLYHRHFRSFKVTHLLLPLLKRNLHKANKDIDIPLVKPDHIPDTYSFILKTGEFKDFLIEYLEKLYIEQKHERMTISSRIRENITRELNKFPIHLLTEKAIIYHDIPKEKGVTLGIHFSLDRYSTVKEILNRWKGKTVLVINVDKEEDCKLIQDLDQWFCHVNKNQPKEQDKDKKYYFSGGKVGTSYPVNTLRNIVLNLVETDLVFLIDADFVPDIKLFDFMNNIDKISIESIDYIKLPKSNSKNLYEFIKEKNVLVIPAFDLEKGQNLPKDKKELMNLIESDKVSPVLMKSKYIQHHEAHRAVNYKKWYETNEIYEIEYKYPFEPVSYHSINT